MDHNMNASQMNASQMNASQMNASQMKLPTIMTSATSIPSATILPSVTSIPSATILPNPKKNNYKNMMSELMKPLPKEDKPNIHLGGGTFQKLEKI